jgi:hypothetical protein
MNIDIVVLEATRADIMRLVLLELANGICVDMLPG